MIWLLSMSAAVAVVSMLATGVLSAFLRRRAILDHPNVRSSHRTPTPRGGGLAVVPITLVAWIAGAGPTIPTGLIVIVAGAWALAVLSWVDDLRSLPAALRLAVQAVVVAMGIHWVSAQGPVFQGLLPVWLDTVAAAVFWLWFLNLFNFMDGIDGITGVETIAIGGGLAAFALFTGEGPSTAWFGATLAAAAAGFLVWNWHPARIFLGDVGSVPVGYLLGFLLLSLAAQGYWAPALILPGYYLADATITLARRTLRGERIWQAHAQHFYQRAVQDGLSHAQVSLAILTADLVLIGLAMTALAFPLLSVAAAAMVVATLLAWMRP
jgi:UDP-N-acetylmuramyl pentapeptide phosphotransferase/UDP-N-acetylglucosamine-1-phosphate transferase